MAIDFWYQPFVTFSGNLGAKAPLVEKVLLSHEQEIYPTTSFDENCVAFDFQKDRYYYVDVRYFHSALKKKLGNGCGWESYEIQEIEKEHEEKSKEGAEAGETQEGEDGSVRLINQINNVLNWRFSNVECWGVHQQTTNIQL